MLWTEKIPLGTIRDPLQLAVFRYSEVYFISGINTQTERLRYYSFLTWAWKNIKEKQNLEKENILDLEKIFTLISSSHHIIHDDEPKGIRSIGKDHGKKFLTENERINLDKFISFGKNNKIGYGNYYYSGSLAKLNILWDRDGEIMVSPAGEEISNIFAKDLGKIESNFWKTKFSKSELQGMHNACCCSLSKDEQNFWKMVFFGFTNQSKSGTKIDHNKKLELPDPDTLTFEEFHSVSEYTFNESDLEELDIDSSDKKEDLTAKIMRTGTFFMLLKIIQQATPNSDRMFMLQTIRDSIYYSEFKKGERINPINFGVLDGYRKYWEVYVHNLYYVSIFEKILSLITEITQLTPLGIGVDELTKKIDKKKFLNHINEFGLSVSDSDTVLDVYENISTLLEHKKTNLSSMITEPDLLEKLLNSEDETESIAIVFILFLLCKYRYSFFDEKQLQILSYNQEKFASVSPKTIYDFSEELPLVEFSDWLLKFVIKRHRYVSAKKLSHGTKAWLFSEEEGILYFNKKIDFKAYHDGKWNNVLEIMTDLGLVQKKSDEEKVWSVTQEGEIWLKKIQ